jgi:hypothetical protein
LVSEIERIDFEKHRKDNNEQSDRNSEINFAKSEPFDLAVRGNY